MKKVIICSLMVIILTILSFVIFKKQVSLEDQMRKNEKQYLSKLREKNPYDDWFITDSRSINQNTEAINLKLSTFIKAIDEYKNTNPETEKIHSYLSKATWAISEMLVDQKKLRGKILRQGTQPPIMLMPADTAMLSIRGNTLIRYHRGQGVVIGFREMPPAFLAANVYHEYCHVIQDTIDHLDMNQHGVVEASAHGVANAILMRAHPDYKNRISEILKRKKYQDFKEAVAGITVKDMGYLDNIVFGPSVNPALASYMVVCYRMAVGTMFIDQKGGTSTEKAILYEWIASVMKN